jgi:hypothetical protein
VCFLAIFAALIRTVIVKIPPCAVIITIGWISGLTGFVLVQLPPGTVKFLGHVLALSLTMTCCPLARHVS